MHSPIGGSVAHIFVKCGAFVKMTGALPPEEPTQDARDGTASHEIGADLIHAAAVAQFPDWSTYAGSSAKDGTKFTEEMFECAKLYAEDVTSVMQSAGVFGGDGFRVEQLTAAPRIHPAAFGTPDTAIYHRAGSKLYVWDYKFGHEYVEAFENWQAVYYFAALLDLYGIDGLTDQNLDLEFRVVQPRNYDKHGPVRSWTVKAADIRGRINQLEAAAARQFDPDAEAVTGPHCGHCRALLHCPTALRAGLGLFEVSAKVSPMEMSPSAMGLQLSIIRRAIKQLENLDTAYTEQVKALMRSGTTVPGWTTEQAFGRDTWACSVEDAIAIGNLNGKNIAKPGVMTPRQAIQAGVPEETVKALTISPKRGFKVVQDTNEKVRHTFTN